MRFKNMDSVSSSTKDDSEPLHPTSEWDIFEAPTLILSPLPWSFLTDFLFWVGSTWSKLLLYASNTCRHSPMLKCWRSNTWAWDWWETLHLVLGTKFIGQIQTRQSCFIYIRLGPLGCASSSWVWNSFQPNPTSLGWETQPNSWYFFKKTNPTQFLGCHVETILSRLITFQRFSSNYRSLFNQ